MAVTVGMVIIIITTQRFYRQLITSLRVIANFSVMPNLREDDVVLVWSSY